MKENVLRVIGILLVIAVGLYAAVAQNNPTRLVIVLPLFAVLITFLLFLLIVGQAEQRINQSLDRRLPPIEHLEKRDEVESQTVRLVDHAAEFIITTGGRSRNREYLKAIENKVFQDLHYWRFIYDEQITHAMCEHIRSIAGKANVFIRQIRGREYGNMLIVDSGFIMVLPVPGHGGLMAINIPNRDSAQRMSRYVMMLTQDSETISTPAQVKALCEECAPLSQKQ